MKVTFVIPAFNEQQTLESLAEAITEHVQPHEHRIVFVDDGSTDGSCCALAAIQARFPTVDLIRFRRNLGKSAALAAGFARALEFADQPDDVVFTMDADLQDDPKEIPRFLEKLNAGYDLVVGWKAVRHDPWHKTIPSRLYNRVIARVFDLPLHDVNCGFKAFRREVVKRLRLYGELHRLIPVFAAHMGYRIAEIPVMHHPRAHGKSKYGFKRFHRGAADALTVWFLLRHGHAPGHFFCKHALGMAGLGLLCLAGGAAGLVAGYILAGAAVCLAGACLLAGGTSLVGLGLIAELLVRRLGPENPQAYVIEDTRR